VLECSREANVYDMERERERERERECWLYFLLTSTYPRIIPNVLL